MSAAIRPAAILLRTTRHAAQSCRLGRRLQSTAASYEDMLSRMEHEYPDPDQPKSRRVAKRPTPPTKQKRTQIPDPDNAKPRHGIPLPDGSEPRRVPKPTWKTSDQTPLHDTPTTHPPKPITPRRPRRPTKTELGESTTNDLDDPAPHPSLNTVDRAANNTPPSATPSREPLASPSQPTIDSDSFNPLETTQIRLSNLSTGKPQARHFDNIFLRDSCACPKCVDESTRQKRFDTADIPSNIRIRDLEYDQDDVVISWKHDIANYGPDHVTRLSRHWLKRSIWSPPARQFVSGKRAWNAASLSQVKIDFDYNDYMTDDRVLFRLLRRLHAFGLVFIKTLPDNESSVIHTANRIGPLKNTFYGDTWDVRSVSNAKNVAYTDVHLGFHMDLLYMQQPPRLQLLHCLRASEQGGTSLFSDSYHAASELHKLDPAAFDILSKTPVNFHYDNDNHHYFQSRRTFQFKQDEQSPSADDDAHVWTKFEAVNWSPPFQGPFHSTEGNFALARDVRAWHQAAQVFRDLTEMQSAVYRRQMEPGECVIFDNRRVLHARTAFAGGERWLRGAYLDDDPYLSKLRVLERQYGNLSSKYQR